MRLLRLLWNGFQAVRLAKKFPSMEQAYPRMKDKIVIRARPASYFEWLRAQPARGADGAAAIDSLLFREEAPGVFSTLVYDFPSSRIAIHPDRLRDWGMTYDEVHAQALRNIRKMGDIEARDFDAPGGTKLRMMCVPEFEYVAVHAFSLADFPAMIGPAGSIVGIPSSDIVMALPLGDAPPGAEAVADMADTIRAIHSKVGDPLSPELFLYKDGAYSPLPAELAGAANREN